MRKLIPLLTVIALLIGGLALDASAKKTTKSKARSSASVALRQTVDGYGDVTGHTYSCTAGTEKLTLTFGRDGYARLNSVDRGSKGGITMYWSYQGQGIVSCFGDDGSQAWDFSIGDGGKTLSTYANGSILTFKLTR